MEKIILVVFLFSFILQSEKKCQTCNIETAMILYIFNSTILFLVSILY